MLDHLSQSPEQKWSSLTWNTKELFVNTFLMTNWSLAIKIAFVKQGVEWEQKGYAACLPDCLDSCQLWVIWATLPLILVYLCTHLRNLSALLSRIAQGEKRETFFNANDIAWGRAHPKVWALWMQISHHLFPLPSATVPGLYMCCSSTCVAPWSPLDIGILYKCTSIVLTIQKKLCLSSGHKFPL